MILVFQPPLINQGFPGGSDGKDGITNYIEMSLGKLQELVMDR